MSLGVALNYIFRSLFSRLKAHQEIEVCAKGQLTLQTKRSNDKRQIQIQTLQTKRPNKKRQTALVPTYKLKYKYKLPVLRDPTTKTNCPCTKTQTVRIKRRNNKFKHWHTNTNTNTECPNQKIKSGIFSCKTDPGFCFFYKPWSLLLKGTGSTRSRHSNSLSAVCWNAELGLGFDIRCSGSAMNWSLAPLLTASADQKWLQRLKRPICPPGYPV